MDERVSPDKSTPVISTNGLKKVFGKLVAIHDLNLQVMRGDVYGFLGPNGSGKTTTIRLLLGLMHPTEGQILLFGMDNTERPSAILRRVGAIIETPVFYPYLSGLDNLRVIAVNSGMIGGRPNEESLKEVLDIVGLSADMKRAYSKYSLGMKQRLGVAAALLTDPELILLDEPTNGLDPSGVIEIRRLIKHLAVLGKTVFLSSHLLFEVQQVCNRVGILQKGTLVRQGDVRELLQQSERVEVRMSLEEQTPYALHILQQAQQRGADWISNVALERDNYGREVVMIDAPAMRSPEVNMLLAQNRLFAAEIHPHQGSLEDLYLQEVAMSSLQTGPTRVETPANGARSNKREAQ
jgi:ABC-2 type transport system ATP-binding protein